MTERFLVVRLGSLGDIVHTFPAVAALRNSFPQAEIAWLTHPRWVPLVESSELAGEIIPLNSRDFAQIRNVLRDLRRRQKWTAAIDYQGLWKSAALPFLAGIPRRIGYSSATIREFGVPILYTDRVRAKSAHIADQNGELSLCAGASQPVGNVTLKVDAQQQSRVLTELKQQGIGSYVVLSPGGGWRSKCWPADRFGALAERITRTLNIRCVINYGPGEENLVAAVSKSSGKANPMARKDDLVSLMALLRKAQCIVGGDTGPLHLAAALGAPTVALFGPTDPGRNGPYPPQPTVLRSRTAVTTYKRGEVTDPSLLNLSVDEVFAALSRTLEARP